jgi:hypothetical protein
VTAPSALVSIGLNPGNPPLDTGFGEFQIEKPATHLLDFLDTALSTCWTSLAFDVDDSVGASRRSFQHSTLLVDDLELTVCSHKHFFTLIIKVGTFVDVLEIF